jgi:two-component SAPR family response regulator
VRRALRTIVVEDEALIALEAEDMLRDIGHEVVISAATVPQALQALSLQDVELGLLDVNVAGMEVFPVADILVGKGIPMVFATGYGAAAIRQDLQRYPTIKKPYSSDDLQRAITEACSQEMGY